MNRDSNFSSKRLCNRILSQKRSFFFCVLVVVVLTLPCGCVNSFMATKMLNVGLKPKNTDRDTAAAWSREIKNHPYIGLWRDSLKSKNALRDTFITAPDGAKLHALYICAPHAARCTAILVHGHTSSSVGMITLGYLYNHNLNCNVLLPDLRLSGLSDGDHYTMGWYERKDVELWIDAAAKIFGNSSNIVVHGVSMGAATTMMLSGDTLNKAVSCLIEDCGYTSVWDEFKFVLKQNYHISGTKLLKTANKKSKRLYKLDFNEASSLNQVKRCKLPMLFIHGDADTYVPTEMVNELYAAKPEPKELWITKGVGHADSFRKYPKEYAQHVNDFITRYGFK